MKKTELHYAIIDGHNDIAKNMILSGSIDINAQDELGYTPLHAAAKCGRVEIVELLLNEGANIHLLDRWGGTALVPALGSSEEHRAIVLLLLNFGIDPGKKNYKGISVLDHVRKIKAHPNRDLFKNFL